MKRFLKPALGILYVLLVVSVLLIQIGAIGDSRGRWIALVEMVLLAVPLVIISRLYLRLEEKFTKENTSSGEERQQKEKELSVAERYELFLTCMSQYDLSERELEVAWFLYCGYTNRQIGEKLFIAETTVKKHVTHIYEKTGAAGRKDFQEKVRDCSRKRASTAI